MTTTDDKPGTGTPVPGPRDRTDGWDKTFAVVACALVLYVGVALGVTLLTGDAIAGAAASNLAAFIAALGYRRWSTGTVFAGPRRSYAKSRKFWGLVGAGLVVCWLAGQTASAWVYATWGSEAYDATRAAKGDSPVLLLFIAALILAPVGEEALMRGIAYPALRKHWPPWAAAFLTATVFALLHGNLVQIVLAVPIGILLAFVYEATQRLWTVIAMHAAFNFAASFVPSSVARSLAEPPIIGVLIVLVALVLVALSPGRFLTRGEGATGQRDRLR